MNWWDRASEQERLAQVDGGIECRMTIRQIAMNCGTTRSVIAYFGNVHGRTFPARNAGSLSEAAGSKRGGDVMRISRARAAGAPNTLMHEAFSLFKAEKPSSLFFPHPHDEDAA